ncbi:MAG: glycerate kinase, partial [Spirochaetia bacterium]|nr:glycerate kinase [Spirochaetia bacterium]
MRVLVAVDKFKGTLRADEVTLAISRGWQKIRPKDQLIPFPISDGGDGFGELLSGHLGAKAHGAATQNAAHQKIHSKWWVHRKTGTAIVESAGSIGLALLPRGRYHPFELDTFGLGLVLRDVMRHSPKKILIGLGGSATNDGGFGMARALGWEFLDSRNHALTSWTQLHSLEKILRPKRMMSLPEIVIASDCKNPLLGPGGATRIYGPQKGLRGNELSIGDGNLSVLAKKFSRDFGKNLHLSAGAGAAGGLGFGILAFLNGRIESGFDLFSRYSGFENALKQAALVISAEGSVDDSSRMGKAVGEVLGAAVKNRKPLVLFGGRVMLRKFPKHVVFAKGLTDLTSAEKAMGNPKPYLELLSSL